MIDHSQLPALLRRVASGDRDSLGEIYDLTAPWVLAALRNRFADPLLATALTQEVFLQIWQRANQFEQRGTLGQTVIAWMDDIATDVVNRVEIREPVAVAV